MKLLDSIFDRTVTGLSRAMDLSWKRNQAITSNIANAETPQYRAVDVSFGKELERAFGNSSGDTLVKTDANHLDVSSSQGGQFVADETGTEKSDGNNVDLDLQMGRLSENSWDYTNAARLIRRQIGMVRSAIRDGR
jgi:flagellar basal-body rod protein FlgB